MKRPVVELNSLLKFFCLSHGLKTATIIDVMYNSNCLKTLLLTIQTTNERLSKEDNTIYCMKFSFLVKMKNCFT